ncbi:hypothetical protein, partial [Pseudomonas meliae]
ILSTPSYAAHAINGEIAQASAVFISHLILHLGLAPRVTSVEALNGRRRLTITVYAYSKKHVLKNFIHA